MTTPEQARAAVLEAARWLKHIAGSNEFHELTSTTLARKLVEHFPTTDADLLNLNADRAVTVDELRKVLKAAEEAFPNGYPVLTVEKDGCSLELDCWPGGVCGMTDAKFLAAVRKAIEEKKGQSHGTQ